MSSQSQSSEEDKFEYNGELVFNAIVRTEVDKDDPEALKQQIIDNLPSFDKGNPSKEGSGALSLDIDQYTEEEDVPSDLANLSDDITAFEYRYEYYPNEPIEVVEYTEDGERYSEAYPRETRSVYAYWDYPNTLFLQGAKTRLEEVAPKINSALGSDVEFEYIDFDKKFLLWLVIKDKVSGNLESDLQIGTLHAGEVTGDAPEFGRDTEVDDSEDLSQSLPILAGILKEMDLAMLEGDFLIDGRKIDAKIYSDGRVRIYANNALYNATKLERLLISYRFLSQLMEEYRQWEDAKPREKYPHPRYFKTLHDEANNQGANLRFDFTSLVQEYARLRNESPSDYDFEFDIYYPETDDE